MRTILYTGKGGVGKTSAAAATALRAASLGHRTIVLSTDAAHSLADCFDVPLSGEPRPIASNLWGQEIDVFREMDAHWGTVQEWLSALMRWRGVDELIAGEMAILPGMEELVGLLNITQYWEGGDYDLIVVDCAPTGETLRLLSFPEMARWYMEKIFPIERKAASALGPLIRPLFNIPIPDARFFDSVQNLFHHLDKMHQILGNPEETSVRLVVNPEKMVIKEAQRTFTYLNLHGYSTDLIICNRVIPQKVEDSYFHSWKETQEKYYRLIQDSFAPLPIRSIPLLEREVVGVDMLETMAQALFGEEDPAQLFYRGRPQEIRREDGYYTLTLPLPFVTKEEISLLRSGEELVIQAGKYRRNLFLPRVLGGLSVKEAKLEGTELKLRFQGPRAEEENDS